MFPPGAQLATKTLSAPEPILDKYPWKDPKAKCIIKCKPSQELINARSPKPIFYRDQQNPNKSYLIITPHQTPRYNLSGWVYKYDIEQDEYKKFSKYPKDFDIEWPMHLLDEKTNILHIFDSHKKGMKVSWKLDFKTGKWEKSSIKLDKMFFAKDVRSTWTQNGMKLFDIGGIVQTFDFNRMQKFKLLSLKRDRLYSHEDRHGQLVFVEKQNKIVSIGQSVADIYDLSIDNYAKGPPMKKRKLNDGNCSEMKVVNLKELDFNEMEVSDNTCTDGGFDTPDFYRFVAFLKHAYIIFVFKRVWHQDHRPWVNPDLHMDVWCLDLFNDSHKWYKSKKQLPGCVCYSAYFNSDIFKNFIHETDNEYVHFLHHSLDHVMINTVDLVPKELKSIHRNAFELAVYGYIREQINTVKFNKDVPASLKHLILHFFTFFV